MIDNVRKITLIVDIMSSHMNSSST